MKTLGRLGWLVFGAYLLVTYGCATAGSSTIPVSDGQAKAVWIAWQLYGRSEPPPIVRWKSGDQLDCISPISGKRGFTIPDVDPSDPDGQPVTSCREGLTWRFSDVLVAWHGEDSFALTVLAHELFHAALARMGIFDPQHKGAGWRAMGECGPGSVSICGAVDRANDEIFKAGL